MLQLARDTSIIRERLYKALGEQANPSFATVVKVMHALGLQFNVGGCQSRAECPRGCILSGMGASRYHRK